MNSETGNSTRVGVGVVGNVCVCNDVFHSTKTTTNTRRDCRLSSCLYECTSAADSSTTTTGC
jgi:hypothetical protein